MSGSALHDPALDRARRMFVQGATRRLEELQCALDCALARPTEENRFAAFRLAHTLAGTSATLGFDAVSAPCFELVGVLRGEAALPELAAALQAPRCALTRALSQLG